MRLGSECELQRTADDRRIKVEACQIAEARGLLRFIDTREGVAWVITDRIRANAVARLIGHLWENGRKAKTLPGSSAKRPIGILEAMKFKCLAIVEGGPDLLAALHFTLECGTEELVAPICMTSVNSEFLPGDLERLRGKSIRIFPHADKEGRKAAIKWLDQLKALSASVDIADFRGLIQSDGTEATDLNDLTSLAYDTWEPLREDLDNLMAFDGSPACR